MRVLFYVEPHPIRDTATYFRDVARKFLPLLATAPRLDTRLFANRATLAEISDATKIPSARIIQPSDDDERVFERHQQGWLNGGRETWLDLMVGSGSITEDYLQVLERIWRRFPFDVIVHWGENGAVTRLIEDRPITRIAMELGCTRPPFMDSIVIDPYGTNASGVVPKLSVADLRDIVNGKAMCRHEAVLAYSETIEAKPYEQQFHPLFDEVPQRAFPAERIAFLPLQLFDDANLLRFSPYETLSDVVLDAVPHLAAAGYTTIIKPHPASKHRPHSSIATAAAQASLEKWQERVIWLDETNDKILNTQIIAMADVVVTVNSSVGFEALYFDKPVVVLGDAVYKPRDLFPTLKDFLAGHFDRARYLEGIGYLRRFFLGGYLQTVQIRSDVLLFEERIGLIDRLYRSHRDDPVALAKGFWQVASPSTQTFAESAALAGHSVAGKQEFGVPSAPIATESSPAQKSESFHWLPAARRLLNHSGAKDVANFTSWLNGLMRSPVGLESVVTVGRIVDRDYYLNAHPDVQRAEVDPVLHFVSCGLVEQRSPQKSISGVSEKGLVDHLAAAAALVLSSHQLENHPLEDAASQRRNEGLCRIRDALSRSGNRIAVVAHLFYRDLVPDILESLGAIPEGFDLIVTLPDWGTRRIEDMVRATYPEALFYQAANRGGDIGPFVDLLPILLDKTYDAVLKIQTKRGYFVAGQLHSELGDQWREEAFDALLGNRNRITSILQAFRLQPELAMVGPLPHYLGLAEFPYSDHGMMAQALLDDADGEGFFAGAMFWVRPDCLRPLTSLSIASFAPQAGVSEGAFAHLIERLFGHAAAHAGMLAGAPVDPSAPLENRPSTIDDGIHARLQDALAQRRAREALTTSKNPDSIDLRRVLDRARKANPPSQKARISDLAGIPAAISG